MNLGYMTTKAFHDSADIAKENITFDALEWLDAIDENLGSDFNLIPLYDDQGFMYSYVM
jgi:hypothetical protein